MESGPTLTQDQIEGIRSQMVRNGLPVRFLYKGQALNIITGELAKKGTNVMYHPVYWNFSKETSKEIAKMLDVKPVFDEEDEKEKEFSGKDRSVYAWNKDESDDDSGSYPSPRKDRSVYSEQIRRLVRGVLVEDGDKVLLQDDDDATIEGDTTEVYTNEKGVKFWAEYDSDVKAWVCYSQVDGHSKSEAFDDWMTKKEDAADICQQLANGTL